MLYFSCPATPRAGMSRKNSCSTFSVNLGLAGMLNERGIKAVTPSALNTPAGPNYSPTVTPCNSPEGSPPRAQSPEPLFGLLSSGADLIKRKLVGPSDLQLQHNLRKQQHQQKVMLSQLERRALRSLNLIEKVESIGLENIISAQRGLGTGIANRSCSSLSTCSGDSLQSLHTSSNSIVDDIHFDRAQIKGVLHRGLKSPTPAGGAEVTPGAKTTTKSGIAASSGNISSSSAYNSEDSDDQGIVLQLKPKATSTTTKQSAAAAAAAASSTAAPGSASETRLKQMQRQKSRRNLKNGMAAQRSDLGTIGGANGGGRVRPDLGKVSDSGAAAAGAATSSSSRKSNSENDSRAAPQSITQSFVGSVSSLLFGRKGGWL